MDDRLIWNNLSVTEDGELLFAGQSTRALAEQWGTPLYLMDEERIRRNCRIYVDAFRRFFPEGSRPCYAGKAACFKQLCRIVAEEDMGLDVVSSGEIYTASAAGFPMEKVCFHGNNKTDADIRYAMDCGVGCFIVDNREELEAVEAEAARRGTVQKCLLRLTPGIDPHTYAAVNTGEVDSKFGAAIATGQAEELTVRALACPHIRLAGFHCHIGSQVFGEDVFERAADIMLEFIAHVFHTCGYLAEELDLGGGYGVRYRADDPVVDIPARIAVVAERVKTDCGRLGIPAPRIGMEPGRSIVADAGLTLYTVGTVKNIPGYKTYVSVDGGMADNPRYALYRSKYTCLNALRMNEEDDMVCTVAGRCCESGDLIQENVTLPSSTRRGDLLAVCTTGAYNFSMSSNYNRLPRPPVVMLKDEGSYEAVRRETLEDLCRNDL